MMEQHQPRATRTDAAVRLCDGGDEPDPRPLLTLALQRLASAAGGSRMRVGNAPVVRGGWRIRTPQMQTQTQTQPGERHRDRYHWIVDACFYRADADVGACAERIGITVDALWSEPVPPTSWPLAFDPPDAPRLIASAVDRATLGEDGGGGFAFRARTTDAMLLPARGTDGAF